MKNTYTEKEKKFLRKLGDKLRTSREQQDLSQEALAFKADLDRTYISGIERGERNISVITLKKIAEALKIDLAKVLNGQTHT